MRFIYVMLVGLLLLIVLSYQAHAATRIIYFYDGDTVKIKNSTKEYKLRLNDIDAPERNQAYGKKSRRALIKLCQNTSVQVTITGIDKYQRQLGSLSCNHQDASIYMLKNGHAWFSKRYAKKPDLAEIEENARKNKLGLWQAEKPTPPWVWRHFVQKH